MHPPNDLEHHMIVEMMETYDEEGTPKKILWIGKQIGGFLLDAEPRLNFDRSDDGVDRSSVFDIGDIEGLTEEEIHLRITEAIKKAVKAGNEEDGKV